MNRRLLFLIPAVVLVAAAWYGFATHRPPAGQPPLANMDLAALRADFNRDADRTRIILLLSPT